MLNFKTSEPDSLTFQVNERAALNPPVSCDDRTFIQLQGFAMSTDIGGQIDMSLALAVAHPGLIAGMHPVFMDDEGYTSTMFATVVSAERA